MANDRFVPRQFTFRGDRLAFSTGILVLGIASAALLVLFRAETHALIPLYAFGVFVGFTLSQTGMVIHWRRHPARHNGLRLLMNGFGAVATGVVAVVILMTKFIDGAWLSVGAIMLLVFIFTRIHRHYESVAEQLQVEPPPTVKPPSPKRPAGHCRAVVPVADVDRSVLRAIEYARTMSDDISAVHVTDDAEAAEALRSRWRAVVPDIPLVLVESPYRSLVAPLLAYVDALDGAREDGYVAVILPSFVPQHFWEGLLHNQLSSQLKKALSRRPRTITVLVPYEASAHTIDGARQEPA